MQNNMGFDLVQNVSSCDIDLSPMLYYSHLPTMAIALLVGFFVFIKSRSLLSGTLLGISLVFSLWLVADLFAWISLDSTVLMFFWSLFGILYVLLFLFCFYFLYVFIKEKDVSLGVKLGFFFASVPAIFFASTKYNIESFNADTCVILPETLYSNYLHILGFLLFMLMIIFSMYCYRRETEEVNKSKILIVSLGLFLFLAAFFLTEFFAEKMMNWGLVDNFSLEYYGLFGMTIFMSALAYLIVQYNAFNIKLIQAQAIMVALVILIASQYAFIQNPTNKILNGVTLALAIVFGWQLVRSVKKEIQQKEELARVNAELDRLDKAKNEFINIASHQLRTPVTVIKGVVSMIQEGDMDKLDAATRKSFLDGAMAKCHKLEEIINDILNATSLTNKKYNVMDKEAEEIYLPDFIAAMIEGFRPETMAKNIDLVIGSLDGTAPKIEGQKKYLEEAFTNIITNAIKYTPSGKARLPFGMKEERARVSISSRSEGETILFTIKDNGIGIAKEEIGNLFKKFYRAKNASNMYVDGTGLGLFIIKEIVRGHGGDVWVESELNVGTTFFIRLPIRQIGQVDVKKYIEAQATLKM